MPNTAFIYGLIDPDSGAIRYVGETTGDVNTRRMWHWYNRRYDAGNMPMKEWLRSLSAPPEVITFTEVPYESRFSAERLFTIGLRRVFGELLLNIDDGAKKSAYTRARCAEAKTPEARARISSFMKQEWARRKAVASAGLIDATPALEARAMGVEMTNMAVLHEAVNGSLQDAPVHEMTRQAVYVKIMAALRIHLPHYVAVNGGMENPAAFKEHTRDMVTSLPDDMVLYLADLWDDGQQQACAEEYMRCLRALLCLRGEVIRAEWNINREEAA